MWRAVFLSIVLWLAISVRPAGAQEQAFRVKYVASGVVYIEGGATAGLKEGMRMTIKQPAPGESPLQAPVIAELIVISVASTSAACEMVRSTVSPRVGDSAFVAREDLAIQAAAVASAETESYVQVLEFAGPDPLEEELREYLPKPPLREVNRFGGRIGFEQDSIVDRTALGVHSHQQGLSFRFDFTRIGNSFWSLGGYWRVRVSSRKREVARQSLTDILQRVYHFGLRYENPESPYVVGLGRLLVPWASSLSTLDGGYFGRKIDRSITVGAFAGTTPDPTAWNYDPNRQLGGAFVNMEAGSFDTARYTITGGLALSRLRWKPERQFLFVENGLVIGRLATLHHNLEVDYRSTAKFTSMQSISVTRSFLTARIQPIARVSFDLSHNYFRVLPSSDPRLVATGLLDNILFQGLNGGARIDLPHALAVYGTAGRSKRSEDRAVSWNRMGGFSAKIPRAGLRADMRYSRFTGDIATGRYRSLSLRRDSSDRWRFEIECGDQRLDSLFAARSDSRFLTGSVDLFVRRFVVASRVTRYRGGGQNYDQLRAGLDFRF